MGSPHNMEKIGKTGPPRRPKNTFPEVICLKLGFFAFNIKWTK